jgi:antitoxin component YwqK of YwqJK toxin-antitoxin module
MAGVVAVLAFPCFGQDQKVVDKSKIVVRGGLVYELNSEVPFTGVAVKFYADGLKYVEIKYTDGVEDRSTVWYWNGQTAVDYEYWDGKAKGKQMYWYENGQRRMEAELRHGQREGRVISWHENGQKESEIEYRDGNLVSRIEWDTNGNLIQPPQPQPSPSPIR